MLNDAQEYGIKNKSYIKNPSKDGYEANSTLTSKYKNMQTYIDGAKQKTATVKAFKDDVDRLRASGKQISSNVIDILDLASKPYGAGYVEPSFANIKVFDPYNPKKFFDNSMNNVQLKEEEISEPIIDRGKNTGFDLKTTKIVATNDALKRIGDNGYDQYKADMGVQDHFDELYKDGKLVEKLNPIFAEVYAYQDPATGQVIKPKIQSGSDLSRAIAISNQPKETIKKTEPVMNSEGEFREWSRRNKITEAQSKANNNALITAITTQGNRKIFNDTLKNYTTSEVIGPNKNLNKLNLPVTYTNAYKNTVEVPQSLADEILMKKGLPYKTKEIKLTPIFGSSATENKIILAYPVIGKNGAPTGEYDWKKAQDVTNEISNKIVDNAVGSDRDFKIKNSGNRTPRYNLNGK